MNLEATAFSKRCGIGDETSYYHLEERFENMQSFAVQKAYHRVEIRYLKVLMSSVHVICAQMIVGCHSIDMVKC